MKGKLAGSICSQPKRLCAKRSGFRLAILWLFIGGCFVFVYKGISYREYILQPYYLISPSNTSAFNLYLQKYRNSRSVSLEDHKPVCNGTSSNETTTCTQDETRGIYFIENSGQFVELNVRQACSVESAAISNPDMRINVMIASENLNTSSPHMQCLENLSNVKFRYLNVTAEFLDSPLEHWYQSGILNKSWYKTVHTSDALRFLMIWKYGGIYLDLDVIVLRSLDYLHNTIGLEEQDSINSAVLIADKEHELLTKCMQELNDNYNPILWASNGPALISRVYRRTCSLDPPSPQPCAGFTVLPEKAFYPLHYWYFAWFAMIKSNNDLMEKFKDSYTVHVWNSFLSKLWLVKGFGQAFDKLAKKHCPCVHNAIGPNWTFY